jgi:hypothetical protein
VKNTTYVESVKMFQGAKKLSSIEPASFLAKPSFSLKMHE